MRLKKYAVLLPLFVIQFFTWLGLFSLWIYTVPVVTKDIFRTVNSESLAYQNGVQWAGICMALYSVLGASLTFLLHKILKKHSKYLVHGAALLAGSIGLMSIYFIGSKYLLLLSFIFIGIGWSSISTVPYLLVGAMAKEGEEEKFYSVFNFSTVIPQAVAAFFLSFLTTHFLDNDESKTVFAGGVFMLIAAGISFTLAN